MGTVEAALLLKIVVPLAVKLLFGGATQPETVAAVNNTITGIANGDSDVTEILLSANEEQTQAIVNGMYNFITGTTGALEGLISGLAGLFTEKK